ncbi:hypothetical protein I317_01658 [Kwoniella heveanensis CBS 569]|nr:hypothetical protein I317_01658 [Kwoniella heveanensis CBS 569]
MTVATASQAGPSRQSAADSSALTPGPTSYHESSQFRHWRYSPAGLADIRQELNQRSVEVVTKNTVLEKEAQISLGHTYTEPPAPASYLTVSDELLLLRFYCSQVSKICRQGFGLPEVVESTAISYLKRFYLKNSVMEWHPKNIMPTCLFLAAKTTNYPVLLDQFIPRFSKLTPADVLDTEFLVAQSLGFEFWVRGAEKALRGWGLDMQNQPNPPLEGISKSLPTALSNLSASLLTDAEFIYTPSQIGLAAWHLADPSLVETFLDHRYSTYVPSKNTSTSADDAVVNGSAGDFDPNGTSSNDSAEGNSGESQSEGEEMYGMKQSRLLHIVSDIEKMIKDGQVEVDVKKVKEVDKRLKQCSNPEKIPGTALYVKRKREKEAAEASAKAAKHQKLASASASDGDIFGSALSAPPPLLSISNSTSSSVISPRLTQIKSEQDNGNESADGRKPLSPRQRLSVNGSAAQVREGVDMTKDV